MPDASVVVIISGGGTSGTSFSNLLGGKLPFAAKGYGLSTLQVKVISEVSGFTELDFSKFSDGG